MKINKFNFLYLFIRHSLKNALYISRFCLNIIKAYVFNVDFEPVTYFSLNNKSIVYVINSKAACSSIKRALMNSDNYSEFKETHYSQIHKLAIERGFQKKMLSKEEKEYFFFSFVRNPFSRIVSLFINKFEDHQKISKAGYFEYEKHFGGLIKQSYSFEKFVNVICTIPDKMAERHFISQSYYLQNSCKKIDFIGKIESFSDDYKVLSQKTGISEYVSFSNKSKGYNYMDYYDLKTLELVNQRYKEDIKEFGYEKDYELIKEYLLKKEASINV